MDTVSSIVSEPSIGQIEYLKDLQRMPKEILPTFVVVEMELNNPDMCAVEKAIAFFLERHESIRTVFPSMDGEVRQMILPASDRRFLIEHVDMGAFQQPYAEVKNEHFNKAAVVFSDIQAGPLVKFYLFRQPANYSFCVVIHHIICDGWSQHIIRNELTLFYQSYAEGRTPDVPPLKAQLRHYCEQQNAWLRETRDASREFWRTRLEGYDTLFDIHDFRKRLLSEDIKGPSTQAPEKRPVTKEELCSIYNNPSAVLYTFYITGERFDKVKKLSASLKCTIASIIYASFYIFLYHYTGKKKLLLAALMADRFTPESHFLIGCLLGGVYFPRDLSDDQNVRHFIGETFRDLTMNCGKIIPSHEYIDLDSSLWRASCDVYLNYIKQNTGVRFSKFANRMHTGIGGIHYPLCYVIYEYRDGFRFKLKYNPRLFNAELIEDIVKCYEDMLDIIAANSDRTIGEVCAFFEAEEHKV